MAEDLTQAIQAATDALYAAEMGQMLRDPGWRTAAHIAIQAAAPHLHVDLQRRLEQAEAELEQSRNSEAEARSVIALHQQNGCGTQLYVEGLRMELHDLRDRHAALEVHTAELWDLLEKVYASHEDESLECPLCDDCKVLAVLQTPPPAAGQAILVEVERLRKVRDALRKVGDRPYDTEAAADLESALEELDALDHTAPQEVEW